MEQPENLTLAEGAQTTPNFDFLLDTPPQTALAEHRAWLKSIKHERPQPDCQSGARYAQPARHLPQDLFFARPKDTGSIHRQLPAVVVLDQCVFHDKPWH